MRTRLQVFALVAGLLAAPGLLSAHHAWPVSRERLVTLKGTVTAYTWGNPHVMMGLEVKATSGGIEKWSVGGPSTSRMEANGWNKATLKPGDVITASGYQFADGSKIVRLEKIVMADGRELFLYGRR